VAQITFGVSGHPLCPTSRGPLAILLCVLLSPIAPRAAEVALGTTGGVYTAPVQINRTLPLQFLIDPGAAVVIIPEAVFTELVENGTISQGDVLGTGIAALADRSSYATLKIRLHELRIGGAVVRDVIAAVSPRLTLPLLGQSLLSRFSSVTFDNRRHALVLSGSPAARRLQSTDRSPRPILGSLQLPCPAPQGTGQIRMPLMGATGVHETSPIGDIRLHPIEHGQPSFGVRAGAESHQYSLAGEEASAGAEQSPVGSLRLPNL
jgi:hypothetical protein